MYETAKTFAFALIFSGFTGATILVFHAISLAHGAAPTLSGREALASVIAAVTGVWAFRQWRARLGPLRATAEDEWIAKLFVPNSEMARVYVFRDATRARLLGVDLRVDDVSVGETYGKTFFQLDLLPGEHLVTGMDRTNGSRADLLLRVDAGRLYFVKQEIRLWEREACHSFTPCEPTVALSAVRRCRMIVAG